MANTGGKTKTASGVNGKNSQVRQTKNATVQKNGKLLKVKISSVKPRNATQLSNGRQVIDDANMSKAIRNQRDFATKLDDRKKKSPSGGQPIKGTNKKNNNNSPQPPKTNQKTLPQNKDIFEWSGPRGNSFCRVRVELLNDPNVPVAKKNRINEIIARMSSSGKYNNGKDIYEIEYKNGVPDFTPVSFINLKADYSEVKAAQGKTKLTPDRKRTLVQGKATEALREYFEKNPGECNAYGLPHPPTKTQVDEWITDNNLTWHETSDLRHIQLVPTEINANFKHYGGIPETNNGAFDAGGFAEFYTYP